MRNNLNISDQDRQQILGILLQTPNFFSVGPIILPSGNKAPFNVDNAKVISNPIRLEKIATLMSTLLQQLNPEVLVAIPTLGLPLASQISSLTQIPFTWVRSQPDPRTGLSLEGEYQPNQTAVMIDDVIGSARTKAKALKNIGNKLKVIGSVNIFGVNKQYQPNYHTWAEENNIDVYNYANWDEIVQYFIDNNKLPNDLGQLFIDYLNNPLAWQNDKAKWQELEKQKQAHNLSTGQDIKI